MTSPISPIIPTTTLNPQVEGSGHEEGPTALMCAAILGMGKVAKSLLDGGCDVHETDSDGFTALDYANASSQEGIVALIEGRGGQTSGKTLDVSHWDLDFFRHHISLPNKVALLQAGFPVDFVLNEKGTTLLMDACQREKSDSLHILDTLLTLGADPNAQRRKDGLSALHIAAKRNNLAAAERLLKGGAALNATDHNGHTPLWQALDCFDEDEDEDFRFCSLLLEQGANVDQVDVMGNSLLHLAFTKGLPTDWVMKLMTPDNINRTNDKGVSPLLTLLAYRPSFWYFEVQAKRRNELLKILPEQGADLQVKDKQGQGILHYAAQNPDTDVLRWALDRVKDIDCRDENGKTPLMQAVSANCKETVEELLRLGANPNLESQQGRTPLYFLPARSSARQGLIASLLTAGADLNHRDQNGHSPLMYCLSQASPAFTPAHALILSGADPLACDPNGVHPLDLTLDLMSKGEKTLLTSKDPQILAETFFQKDNLSELLQAMMKALSEEKPRRSLKVKELLGSNHDLSPVCIPPESKQIARDLVEDPDNLPPTWAL